MSIWRALDDTNIRIKLLIAPLFAALALALICAAAFSGFSAEFATDAQLERLEEYRLKHTTATRIAAARLQMDLFRLTSLGLMGVEPAALEALAAATRHDAGVLDRAVAGLLAHTADGQERARLVAAVDAYRAQGANVVGDVLRNPAAGARNAAVALDAVIGQARHIDVLAEQAVDDAEQDAIDLNERQKLKMLALLVIGSGGVILFNLVVASRIARPIRRLTLAMSRLAEKHYDAAIPAIGQRDEVGSMARAVQVFREGMQRADALSQEQVATQGFLDAVLENMPAPIAVKDAITLRVVHINRATETFLGVPRAACIGRAVADLIPGPNVAAHDAMDRAALAAGAPTVEDGFVYYTPGNGPRLAVITRVAIAGPDGAPQYLLSMIEDVTERRRAEQRITYMARYDALTDLPNRTLFGEELARAMREARLGGAKAAVFCIDLDHFKDVNDSLGHAAGDKLLRTVANRMRQCLREGDTLARLGGDEFAVIQPGIRQPHEMETLARRLLDTVREPIDLDGQQVFIGLSIGIAVSAPGIDDGDLVKQADMALYAAKDAGRGRYSVFAPEMDARLRLRRALEQDLRAAIGTEQILLHYQPQVDLATGTIVGAEALMRWNRPGHGPVPPDRFIPIAEETGLIGPLGVWLLEEACREATRWPGHLLIAVNFSPVQFRQPGFLDIVKDALAHSGLDPHRLELEVTEGILLHDTEETLGILAALRTLGVRLAMDDFGTGYASLGYLRKFRFDKIKIDRSFVKNLATDPSASAIVRAVVGLSELLGMCTNAEGVEDQEQVDLLLAHGCMEAQGFRFWRPMPAAELRVLLQAAASMPAADAQLVGSAA